MVIDFFNCKKSFWTDQLIVLCLMDKYGYLSLMKIYYGTYLRVHTHMDYFSCVSCVSLRILHSLFQQIKLKHQQIFH